MIFTILEGNVRYGKTLLVFGSPILSASNGSKEFEGLPPLGYPREMAVFCVTRPSVPRNGLLSHSAFWVSRSAC